MNVSTRVKITLSLLAVAALVGCHVSLNKSSNSSQARAVRGLKGGRGLQFGFPGTGGTSFSGGAISGGGNGGGTAGGSGEATNVDDTGDTSANGSGSFGTTGGSGGFINTVFGTASGTSAGGGSGDQLGVATNMMGVGTIGFAGTTNSAGVGGFGAGLSPVGFNTITMTIPGTPIQGGGGSKSGSKSGGGFSGFTPDTTTTITVPYATGPTGGFASGNGDFDIATMVTGGPITGTMGTGTASSTGNAANLGGGMATAGNYFGMAGGLASGAGSGTGAASGMVVMAGTFAAMGPATGTFNNQGSGIFGAAQSLAFPSP